MNDSKRRKADDEPVAVRETREGTVRIEVDAKPRSRKSRIVGVRNGALVVHLAAAPVDGEANAELVATLARLLGIPRRDVTIVRGATARSKVVEVRGLSGVEVQARLRA
jgi:uncharacterized protein (TIGR00251 family)